MIEFLKGLSLSQEERFESLGQILDSMVQVIEAYGKTQYGDELSSRSFGELEAYLRKHEHFDIADQLSEIRAFRKTISIRDPEEKRLMELRQLVIQLIEDSGLSHVQHKYRIRYIPVLKNSTGIESSHGFSRFNLYHGSISHIPCSTLIISASQEGDALDGQVLNALKWRYDLPAESQLSLKIQNIGEIKVFDTAVLDSHFDHLIILAAHQGKGVLSNSDCIEFYKNTFGLLNYLNFTDYDLKDVAMSFLFGNRMEQKTIGIQSLIIESLNWLKQSKNTKAMHCSVLHIEEMELCNNEMNQSLNRASLNDASIDPVLKELKSEIRNLLDDHREGLLQDAIKPLIHSLSSKEGLNIELICTFSRTLCELIVREVGKKINVKTSGDLLSSIEHLRSSGHISPWVASYMHSVRIMGNKSVHPSKSPPKYIPNKLDESDLMSSLIAIKALLNFWDNN